MLLLIIHTRARRVLNILRISIKSGQTAWPYSCVCVLISDLIPSAALRNIGTKSCFGPEPRVLWSWLLMQCFPQWLLVGKLWLDWMSPLNHWKCTALDAAVANPFTLNILWQTWSHNRKEMCDSVLCNVRCVVVWTGAKTIHSTIGFCWRVFSSLYSLVHIQHCCQLHGCPLPVLWVTCQPAAAQEKEVNKGYDRIGFAEL